MVTKTRTQTDYDGCVKDNHLCGELNELFVGGMAFLLEKAMLIQMSVFGRQRL